MLGGFSQRQIVLLAFFGAVLLIGSNLVAIRYSNRELDPFWSAGTRFVIASLLFCVVMRITSASLPRGRALAGAVLYGVVGIASYFACVYLGLVEVKAGYGQVLLSLAPLLTLFLAIAQGQEFFRWQGLIGGLVATAGVAIVFRDQINADVPLGSVVLLVLAAGCAAQAGIIVKRFPPTNLVATNAVAMGIGGVALLLMSMLRGETQALPQGLTFWVAYVYLATLGTVGTFMLFLFVYKQWTASAAAYQYVAAPIIAVALSAVLLEEGVSRAFFLGGGLVVAGVYVGALMPASNLGRIRRRAPATE